jgi:hypothetical protein
MRPLIKFWESLVDTHAWMMDRQTRAMVRETIRVLKQVQKASRFTRVEREAEIVRIAKQSCENSREVRK